MWLFLWVLGIGLRWRVLKLSGFLMLDELIWELLLIWWLLLDWRSLKEALHVLIHTFDRLNYCLRIVLVFLKILVARGSLNLVLSTLLLWLHILIRLVLLRHIIKADETLFHLMLPTNMLRSLIWERDVERLLLLWISLKSRSSRVLLPTIRVSFHGFHIRRLVPLWDPIRKVWMVLWGLLNLHSLSHPIFDVSPR